MARRFELRALAASAFASAARAVAATPRPGEAVSIPAKRVPYFKPAKELKELISEETPSGPPPVVTNQINPSVF